MIPVRQVDFTWLRECPTEHAHSIWLHLPQRWHWLLHLDVLLVGGELFLGRRHPGVAVLSVKFESESLWAWSESSLFDLDRLFVSQVCVMGCQSLAKRWTVLLNDVVNNFLLLSRMSVCKFFLFLNVWAVQIVFNFHSALLKRMLPFDWAVLRSLFYVSLLRQTDVYLSFVSLFDWSHCIWRREVSFSMRKNSWSSDSAWRSKVHVGDCWECLAALSCLIWSCFGWWNCSWFLPRCVFL